MLPLVSGSGFAEESKKALTERIGTIDQTKDDHFVIDDCQFKQASGIKFYTNSKTNTYANRSRFKKGTFVGYQITENGQITAMWLEKKWETPCCFFKFSNKGARIEKIIDPAPLLDKHLQDSGSNSTHNQPVGDYLSIAS